MAKTFKLILLDDNDQELFMAEVHGKLVRLQKPENLGEWLIAEFRPWFKALSYNSVRARDEKWAEYRGRKL